MRWAAGPLCRCAGCGDDQRRLSGIYCARCIIPDKLRSLISDDQDSPHPRLLALEQYLFRDDGNVDTVLTWIRRIPISLRAAAKLPMTGATGYLAALLMESGVVPTENFDRVRLDSTPLRTRTCVPCSSGTRPGS